VILLDTLLTKLVKINNSIGLITSGALMEVIQTLASITPLAIH